MPTIQEMTTSLEDVRFFNDKIEKIVQWPQGIAEDSTRRIEYGAATIGRLAPGVRL
jgi:hypothetical protein